MTGKGTACVSSDKSKQSSFKLAGLPVFIEPYCNGTKEGAGNTGALSMNSGQSPARPFTPKPLQLGPAQSCRHEPGTLTRIDV